MDALPHGSAVHKGLLRMSWRSLILMAIGEAHEWFTPAFLTAIEASSPFRFAFLRERRKKLTADRGLLGRVFDLMLKSQNSDTAALPEISATWRCGTLEAAAD